MPYRDPNTKKANNAQYRAAHVEELRASRKRYWAAHREKKRKLDAESRVRRRTQTQAYSARHYLEHREEKRAYGAQYNAEHPEVAAAANTRRRARQLALPATLTAEQWRAIKRLYKNCCAYCGTREARLTQDHVTPITRGGGTVASNIVPACQSCNSKKATGPPPTMPPIRLLL